MTVDARDWREEEQRVRREVTSFAAGSDLDEREQIGGTSERVREEKIRVVRATVTETAREIKQKWDSGLLSRLTVDGLRQ